jgi:ABC-type nitrate/sulfonate/bicarbonate transport system permease component
MRKYIVDQAKKFIPPVAFATVLLCILETAVRMNWVDRAFVPSPMAVFSRTFEIVVTGKVFGPLFGTLFLLSAGYAIGCVTAVILGTLMGNYRRVYNFFEPLIELIRPIPKAALLPALILFLGFGATMKVTIVAMATFFPVLINTIQGVRTVDPVLTDMARTYGRSGMTILWRILLPASAPYILSGMRISLGISLIVVIIAEMVSGTGGLGDVIVYGQRMFLVVDSYAWLIVVAALGFALNMLFRWAERRSTFWVAPASE